MAMRYNRIIENSFVDGPGGPRVVLVMQGCSIRCPGCQNKELWPSGKGQLMAAIPMALRLLEKGNRITITGGEPTDQAKELWRLMVAIRSFQIIGEPVHIIVYTGHRFEEMFENLDSGDEIFADGGDKRFALAALLMADVVVDGPFEQDKDHDYLQWRGSENQRPINIAASTKAARAFGLGKGATQVPKHLHIENWDVPTLMLTDEGIIGAKGLIEELTNTQEETSAIRRCGQI